VSEQSTIVRSGPVALSLIDTDQQMQPRQLGLDDDHVDALIESEPNTWPPIKVRQAGNRYQLIDGFHRVEAAHRLGLSHITADVGVFPGGIHDAFALNASHGKALTLADRKAQARRLKAEQPALSNIAIARACGLSDHTVKAAIEGKSTGLANANSEDAKGAPTPTAPPEERDPVVAMLVDMYAAEKRDGKVWGLGADVRAASIKKALARFTDPSPQEIAAIAARWGAAAQKAAAGANRV
jgi:ParB-like chromosome segregation protein Spo0J